MSRPMDAATKAATEAPVVRQITLCRLDYESGPLYVASTPFPVTWNWDGSGDQVFQGVGSLGSVSLIEEGSELQNYPLELTLNGVSTANLALALNEFCQGRDAKIWQGYMNINERTFEGAPKLFYRGRMDTQVIKLSEAKIILTIQSRLADWGRARIRRYTNEDQQAIYPGDKGLEFMSQMENKQIIWGTQ